MYRDFALNCSMKSPTATLAKEEPGNPVPRIHKKSLPSPECSGGTKLDPLTPLRRISPVASPKTPDGPSLLRKIAEKTPSSFKEMAMKVASPIATPNSDQGTPTATLPTGITPISVTGSLLSKVFTSGVTSGSGKSTGTSGTPVTGNSVGVSPISVTAAKGKLIEVPASVPAKVAEGKIKPAINPIKEALEEEAKATGMGLLSALHNAKRSPYIDATKLAASPITNTEGVRRDVSDIPTFDLGPPSAAAGSATAPVPATFPAPPAEDHNKYMTLCSCGNDCKDYETQCEMCAEKFKGVSNVGYLYENTGSGMLYRKFYKLLGNQLYGIDFFRQFSQKEVSRNKPA